MTLQEERLENISKQLKLEVSKYEVESFVGFFIYFIKYPIPNDSNVLHNFRSRLRDFSYLISLNVSANTGLEIFKPNDEILMRWASMIEELKVLYVEIGVGDPAELNDDNEDRNKIIHQFMFNSYFENGTLNYREQDLDRLERIFTPYNQVIKDDFGFDVEFLINIYLFTEMVANEKHKRQRAFENTVEFQKFLYSHNGTNTSESLSRLPDAIFNDFCAFNECTHASLKFIREDYYSAFPKAQVDSFLNMFSCKPVLDDRYLFFAQANPFEEKPILSLPTGEFLHVYSKQLPEAFCSFLYRHLQQKPKLADKIRKQRDRALEKKVEDVFRKFFKADKSLSYYTNYHVEKNTEQDLLILNDKVALIIEVKASKLREPFRNASKGFKRLKDDFDESIQYGYKQCLRVEDKFFAEEEFNIYDEKDKPILKIDPKKYEEIYSIVVTLERFGPVQTDLGYLLSIEEDYDFPWAVYIDDLETFLLALQKLFTCPILQLRQFLRYRQQLHRRVFAMDELDICGAFLSNRSAFKKLMNEDQTSVTFDPHYQHIFDEIYFSGLGFDNEIFIGSKKNKKFNLKNV